MHVTKECRLDTNADVEDDTYQHSVQVGPIYEDRRETPSQEMEDYERLEYYDKEEYDDEDDLIDQVMRKYAPSTLPYLGAVDDSTEEDDVPSDLDTKEHYFEEAYLQAGLKGDEHEESFVNGVALADFVYYEEDGLADDVVVPDLVYYEDGMVDDVVVPDLV